MDLGAALGALLPWKAVPGVYMWLALTLSGCSMFFLAGNGWFDADAIFAAALYASNPYYIVIVYWRSAFAELLAGALLPLLLLYALRLWRKGRTGNHSIGPDSCGCMADEYSRRRNGQLFSSPADRNPGGYQAIAARSALWCARGFLGAALAAFFLLPAAYEGRWVNISEVLSPGVRPQDNFLFAKINDADHNRFNLLVSLVASGRNDSCSRSRHSFLANGDGNGLSFGMTVFGWALFAVLLNFSFTSFPMDASARVALRATSLALAVVPECSFRDLGDRGFAAVDFTLIDLSRDVGSAGVRVASGSASVVGDGGGFCRDARTAADRCGIRRYRRVRASREPTHTKSNKDAPRVALNDGPTQNEIQSLQHPAMERRIKIFTVQLERPGKLALRLFNYPAWHAEVNGQTVSTSTRDVTGQMLIPVQAGESRVTVSIQANMGQNSGENYFQVSLLYFSRAFSSFDAGGKPVARHIISFSIPQENAIQATLLMLQIYAKHSVAVDMILLGVRTQSLNESDSHRDLEPGKLCDFAGAALPLGIEIKPVPNFASIPAVVEDGMTFEENARKKAEGLQPRSSR